MRSKLRQQSSPLVLPGWGVCYEVIYSDLQWKDLDPSTSLRAFLGSKSPSLGLFDDSLHGLIPAVGYCSLSSLQTGTECSYSW